MWCAYVFALIALISLPSRSAPVTRLLSLADCTDIPAVGIAAHHYRRSKCQAAASDARAESDHETLLSIHTLTSEVHKIRSNKPKFWKYLQKKPKLRYQQFLWRSESARRQLWWFGRHPQIWRTDQRVAGSSAVAVVVVSHERDAWVWSWFPRIWVRRWLLINWVRCGINPCLSSWKSAKRTRPSARRASMCWGRISIWTGSILISRGICPRRWRWVEGEKLNFCKT